MAQVGRIGTQVKLRVERARARYGWLDIALGTFKRYSSDDGGFYAASLTYYMFFSIFPLLLCATAILGFFLDPQLKTDLIESGIKSIPMLQPLRDPKTLSGIEENAGTLALVGVVLALYAGSGGVNALAHALNRVNRVEKERNFLAARIASLKWLAFVAGIGILTLVPSGLADYAGTTGGVAGDFLAVLGHLLGIAVAFGLFLVTFRFLPNGRRSWSDVLPGAALAAVLFEILKLVGGRFLRGGAGGREATFGAFAAAATLLVAAYLLAQVVLLAAELNALLAERRKTRQSSIATEEAP